MIYLIKTKNYMTTFHYYDIIQQAASCIDTIIVCENCKEFFELKASKNSAVIVGHVSVLLYVLFCGYKKTVLWCQGIVPEERRMQGRGQIYFYLTSFFEKIALKKSSKIIFVSKAEKEHFEKKYKMTFLPEKFYIMPCFNETVIHEEAFEKDDKQLFFTYAGGLGVWQCIDEMLELYKRIEDNLANVTLLFLTNQVEDAMKKIQEHGIKSYLCKYVEHNELNEYLKKAHFGFVLRQNDPVNIVATPTKFSTYLSYGITPIFSSCINSFYNETVDFKYVISLESLDLDQAEQTIKSYIDRGLDSKRQKEEYMSVFSKYFNTKLHIRNIEIFLKSLINGS